MANYMLVSFKTCPWVQRSAIILREKNMPFEFRHIERDNRPDWFLAISPHKKVPVLRIDDKVSLFESNAINEYLDETIAPRLHPDDPMSARSTAPGPTMCRPLPRGHRLPPMPTTRRPTRPRPRRSRRRSSGSNGRSKSKARAVLQRRQIFAGRCRLCAVPAALFLPRPHQAARRHREISAAQGLGRRADGAALDPFVPRSRVRGDLPRKPGKRGSYLSSFLEPARAAAE